MPSRSHSHSSSRRKRNRRGKKGRHRDRDRDRYDRDQDYPPIAPPPPKEEGPPKVYQSRTVRTDTITTTTRTNPDGTVSVVEEKASSGASPNPSAVTTSTASSATESSKGKETNEVPPNPSVPPKPNYDALAALGASMRQEMFCNPCFCLLVCCPSCNLRNIMLRYAVLHFLTAPAVMVHWIEIKKIEPICDSLKPCCNSLNACSIYPQKTACKYFDDCVFIRTKLMFYNMIITVVIDLFAALFLFIAATWYATWAALLAALFFLGATLPRIFTAMLRITLLERDWDLPAANKDMWSVGILLVCIFGCSLSFYIFLCALVLFCQIRRGDYEAAQKAKVSPEGNDKQKEQRDSEGFVTMVAKSEKDKKGDKSDKHGVKSTDKSKPSLTDISAG